MDEPYEPMPTDLQTRIRAMTHDLRRTRELMAAGRITPQGQAALDRFLGTRLERIEVEVHSRLLNEARRSRIGRLN